MKFTPEVAALAVKAIRSCESETTGSDDDVYICLWMPQDQMDAMMAAADEIEMEGVDPNL